VRPAAPGEPRRPGEYLEEFLEGVAGSAAFLADGRQARLLGASEQLVPRSPGSPASPFRYAGNIAGPIEELLAPAERAAIARAADVLTGRFGLRGLNGLDYIRTSGGPALLEVNPRFTASMEILEEIACVSFFDLHLQALAGSLPAAGPEARALWMGKGILYADDAVEAPSPEALETLGVRDRPHRGERFEAGQPLCTLIVTASTRGACRSALQAREREVRSLFQPIARDRLGRPASSRKATPWLKPARPW
jgi:predicted ATP-grasp superfamily ATP-dependent carboligase